MPSSLGEGEASEYTRRLLSTYGPFSVVLYARVKKFKLVPLSENGDFVDALIEFYLRNVQEVNKTKEAYKSIKKLIDFLPSSRRFIHILKFHKPTAKERILFKLAIDVLENFYRATGRPMFKRLQTKVFPLALRFYRRMTDEALTDINLRIRAKSKKSISLLTE